MKASQPCDLCGCTEVNLHDGFYFCIECGTQDTNFQETVVEVVEAPSGQIVHGQKKKVHRIVEEEKEMSDTWYKWHAFNFLLKGTADELLQFGADPSFKTKLMWVWVRYIKKYLKKDDMGLNKNPHKEVISDKKEDSDSDIDEQPENLLTIIDANKDKVIKSFTFNLLISLMYIALNLDKSAMTLTDLMKITQDGLLSVPNHIERVIPEELKPKLLKVVFRKGMYTFKSTNIRTIAMTLFKRLELGNPIVPDLRLIIDNYLKELCLPSDLKQLVLSLMHYKPCSFLDVNTKDKVVSRMPAYEFHVMTYIIWAMKLCFGLDCDYDLKLSAAAEVINEKNDFPKSYYINGESAPSDRLFSYREWVMFYHFRQILLRHYCYRYASKCTWDTDDYIALEHHMDLLQTVYKKDLKDEMAYDLLQRIKGGEVQSFVIPRTEFKPTLTPFYSYSQVVAHHLQDPELKIKLMEDFTQYSLKYVIEDWNLVNPNSREKTNLVKGIRTGNKVVTHKYEQFTESSSLSKKMIYVRNCENHNWLTTKPPTIEHLVRVDKLHLSNGEIDDETLNNTLNNVHNTNNNSANEMKDETFEDEVDSKSQSISEISLASSMSSKIQFVDETHVLESNKLDANVNIKVRDNSNEFPDIVSEYSFSNGTLSNSITFLDDTKVFKSSKLDETEKSKLREIHHKLKNPKEIQEETEGVNIFDDDFKPVIKEELEEYNYCGMNNDSALNITDNFADVSMENNQAGNINDNNSDVSSLDSVTFNEATFDRAKTIKEIMLFTCAKHKLPIPSEYNPGVKRRKEMGAFSRNINTEKGPSKKIKRNITIEKKTRGIWQAFVTDYHSAMQKDALNEIAQQVSLVIQNLNCVQQVNEDLPFDTEPVEETIADNNMDFDALSNHSDTNATNKASESRSKITYESDENRLFSDESDGETHAKDLLPKKKPEFDENVYDSSQLYLKTALTAEDGEIELDPQLSDIINKKMLKDAKDPSLLTWTEERKKLKRPDSEDEITLIVLQELTDLTNKLSQQSNEDLEPFLKNKVDKFKYWFRFYKAFRSPHLVRVFENEVSNKLPKSFTFLLRQCAFILSTSEGALYKNLQSFEKTTLEKLGLDVNQNT